MTTNAQRYPLAWPAHRPRTPSWKRKSGQFKSDRRDITMAGAVRRVDEELTRLGALYPVLSTNVELRLDGQPRGGARAPVDPGVCLYFTLNSKPFALACDTYSRVEQNIAALAAHLDATRAIERHGVASAADTLEAFSALPPPSGQTQSPQRSWRDVLGFRPDFPDHFSPLEAQGVIARRYRDLAASAHPDRGGTNEAMAELTAARDAALKEPGVRS